MFVITLARETPAIRADKPDLIASDGDLSAFVTMSDGTVLPITWDSLLEGRQHVWYTPIDGVFNVVFYSALRSRGVMKEEVQPAIALLTRHRRALGLTAAQLRGVYGLEKGVFGRHGRFLSESASESNWERELLESRQQRGDGKRQVGPFGCDPDVWDHIEADASLACRHKLDQVNIDVEFRWIRSNLGEWPNFSKAPSRGAIRDWLEINRVGGEALKRDFLKLAWTRRLAPGDRQVKKTAVFEEDAVEDEALSEYDESLEERLGEVDGE